MKGVVRFLVRFGLITLLGFLVTPYIRRVFERLAQHAPEGSMLKDFLVQLGDKLGSSLLTAFGESVIDLMLR